jgi:dUTPase
MKYIMNIHVLSEDPEVLGWYKNKVDDHNSKITSPHPDSGFDLPCPKEQLLQGTTKYNLEVKISMSRVTNDGESLLQTVPSAFYLYPRSSISNTPVRLANSVGIIDSGYRGPMIACFDGTHQVEKMQRLVQICTPTLEPMYVYLVNSLGETVRNEGGFGSTGV